MQARRRMRLQKDAHLPQQPQTVKGGKQETSEDKAWCHCETDRAESTGDTQLHHNPFHQRQPRGVNEKTAKGFFFHGVISLLVV